MNRTIKVWFRTLARDDNTVMYAVCSVCTHSYTHAPTHTVIIQTTVHMQVYTVLHKTSKHIHMFNDT